MGNVGTTREVGFFKDPGDLFPQLIVHVPTYENGDGETVAIREGVHYVCWATKEGHLSAYLSQPVPGDKGEEV